MEHLTYDMYPSEFKKALEEEEREYKKKLPEHKEEQQMDAVLSGIKWGALLGVVIGILAMADIMSKGADFGVGIGFFFLRFFEVIIAFTVIYCICAKIQNRPNPNLDEARKLENSRMVNIYETAFKQVTRRKTTGFENSRFAEEIASQFTAFFMKKLKEARRDNTIKEIAVKFLITVDSDRALCFDISPDFIDHLYDYPHIEYDFNRHRIEKLPEAADQAALSCAIVKLMKSNIEKSWPAELSDRNKTLTVTEVWDSNTIHPGCKLIYKAINKNFVALSKWQ